MHVYKTAYCYILKIPSIVTDQSGQTVGLSQYTGLLVYSNICPINIVSQYEKSEQYLPQYIAQRKYVLIYSKMEHEGGTFLLYFVQ